MKRRKQTELSHPNFVAVRLSDTEITILDQACASLGTTRSEYLRRLLTEKKIYNNVEIVADIKLLRDLVGQYGKIGSNLNQIAKHFNTGGTHSQAMENEIHQCIEYSCAMKSHFRKFRNQSSGTRKSPILYLMTYPFLFGYWSRPCRICGA